MPVAERFLLVEDDRTVPYARLRLTSSRDYRRPPEVCVTVEPDGVTLALDPARADLLVDAELAHFADPVPVPGTRLRTGRDVAGAALPDQRRLACKEESAAAWTLASAERMVRAPNRRRNPALSAASSRGEIVARAAAQGRQDGRAHAARPRAARRPATASRDKRLPGRTPRPDLRRHPRRSSRPLAERAQGTRESRSSSSDRQLAFGPFRPDGFDRRLGVSAPRAIPLPIGLS